MWMETETEKGIAMDANAKVMNGKKSDRRYMCDSRTRFGGAPSECVALAVDSLSDEYDRWCVDIVDALPSDELDCEEDRFYDDYSL